MFILFIVDDVANTHDGRREHAPNHVLPADIFTASSQTFWCTDITGHQLAHVEDGGLTPASF